LGQDFIADCNIINFATVTMCTQLRTLRTGSYAPVREKAHTNVGGNFIKFTY